MGRSARPPRWASPHTSASHDPSPRQVTRRGGRKTQAEELGGSSEERDRHLRYAHEQYTGSGQGRFGAPKRHPCRRRSRARTGTYPRGTRLPWPPDRAIEADDKGRPSRQEATGGSDVSADRTLSADPARIDRQQRENAMASLHVDHTAMDWSSAVEFYGPQAVWQGRDIVQLKVLSDRRREAAASPGWCASSRRPAS